jgi:BirA family transcriptional regulator, biotin operon repressor / biotin---[acetyl-CoA-carboxylase] ligase
MIPHALSGLAFVERFYSYPVLESTNATARSMSHHPKKGIYCIQADRQSTGRGRRGGAYFSDCQGGLWVSLVITTDDPTGHFIYNRAISLAVALTLEQCGKNLPVSIKWPNDIYWGKRKICGILLENHPVFSNVIIIGFGLNVNMRLSDFPDDLQKIATSVLIETEQHCSLSALLRTILRHYAVIQAADQNKIHGYYLNRLYGIGQTISINGLSGIFSSVAPDGRLKLVNNGIPIFINSGSPVFPEMQSGTDP